MSVQDSVITILGQILALGERVEDLGSESPIVGAIPEFDSMAVVSVLTALEDQYGISIDDDEVDAQIFETVGSLVKFVDSKLS